MGSGFRGLGFMGLGFRGFGFRGLGFRVAIEALDLGYHNGYIVISMVTCLKNS